MSLANSRILIAGSTGLVGINLIRFLLEKFPQVKITGTYHQLPPFIEDERVTYIQADLTEKECCDKVAEGCNYAVLGAANTGGAGAALTQPYRQVTDNLVINSQLLESLNDAGVKKTILISSATVYQEFDGAVREEQLDLNKDPHQSYLGVGWVNRAVEKLAEFWYRKYCFNTIVVRSSNIYGPWAKFNPQNSNFIPALIRKAVDSVEPFKVWGSAEVVRDVIYVKDFVSALVLLLEKEEISFDIFNLGSGKLTTVGEVVRHALKYAGHCPKAVQYTEDSPTTIQFRQLRIDKIRGAIPWEPLISIEEGVKLTTEWWIKNKTWWKK